MATIQVKTKPDVCPHCGGKLLPILYGEPTPEAYEACEKGLLILGGCCVDVKGEGYLKMPKWECKDCHLKIQNQ